MKEITVSAVLDRMENVQRGSYTDTGAKVKFFYDGRYNKKKSDQEGRPVYDTIECFSITFNDGREEVTEAKPIHKQEYAEKYRIFKEQNSPEADGTMLAQWSLLPKSVCLELLDLGLITVEELAICKDIEGKVQMYEDWIKLANDWLESSKEEKNLVPGLRREITNLKKKVAKLEDDNLVLKRRLGGQGE